MKITQLKTAAAFLSALLFALTASAAPEEFQGRVKMSLKQGDQSQNIEYFIKGERMRIDPKEMSAAGGSMIMDMKNKQIFVLMPAQKMYMTMPIPNLGDTSENSPKPEPQNETREILGYKARKYTMQHNGADYEMWATEELGRLGALQLPGQKPGAADAPWAKGEFFPLQIIESRNGQRTLEIRVEEIEKQELPDSLFQPPADFQAMQAPAMPGMP